MAKAAVTYTSYLEIEQLLTAQNPKSGSAETFEHDEMLFIIIHQVYELWFKQLLHEIDYLMQLLRANNASKALHTVRRMLTILKTIVAQVDVIETMTPLEFNSFREFLDTASGFQSLQFREVEFVLGHKRLSIMKHFPEGVFGRDRLMKRYNEPTLWDAFLHFLSLNGHAVPKDDLGRDITQPIAPSPQLQALLVDIYRSDTLAVRICERLLDLDEGLQEWRYRHVKMVQRTIGVKMGTGRSSGVQYLLSTIQPVFPDLWAIRSQL